jgi:intraflagellar transport protein 88
VSIDSRDVVVSIPNSHNIVVGSSTKQSPLVVAKNIEKQVNQMIAQTVSLRKEGKHDDALESAKQGTKIEQSLRRHQKSNSLSSGSELTHSAWFNLATAYVASGMPDEALKTYTTLLTLHRGSPSNGRVRINMGNLYYGQKQYPSAIKMYKMALDQIQQDDRSLARKIRRNIGNAYFSMGQIRDAVKNFEEGMDTADDFRTGFNLLICHLALGDMNRVKKYFVELISVQLDRDAFASNEGERDNTDPSISRVKQANHFLLTAARLIAPVIEGDDWAAGYDWVCDALDNRHEVLAVQIKLEQSIQRLHCKEFDSAIKSLKGLQKKGNEVKSATLTNLSFVSFLEGNIEQASEYADASLTLDRYNAKALVNKANCLFLDGDFDSAKSLYLEAIGVQADCSQAIFNLGLANAQLGLAEEAILAFDKVHLLTPNDPQVLFQIADIYELQGRSEDAVKWFNVLAARVPSDPTILARLGQLYTEAGDESQGLHYQLESFRHYPTDLGRINLIGTWFMEHDMHER